MIKRILLSLVCALSFALMQAQEQGYDKSRFANGLEQIANSNRNYFKNVGWIENNWYVLSNWYPDVLLLKNEDKYRLAKVINSDEVIRKFESLNETKKKGVMPSFQDIEQFNIYLWNALQAEVEKMYGK